MARIKINRAGLAKAVASPGMDAALGRAAAAIASNVRAQGIRVEDENGGADEVDLPVISDGPQGGYPALVTIDHPAGLAVQAKHGALTKAAAQAGLEVRGAGG